MDIKNSGSDPTSLGILQAPANTLAPNTPAVYGINTNNNSLTLIGNQAGTTILGNLNLGTIGNTPIPNNISNSPALVLSTNSANKSSQIFTTNPSSGNSYSTDTIIQTPSGNNGTINGIQYPWIIPINQPIPVTQTSNMIMDLKSATTGIKFYQPATPLPPLPITVVANAFYSNIADNWTNNCYICIACSSSATSNTANFFLYIPIPTVNNLQKGGMSFQTVGVQKNTITASQPPSGNSLYTTALSSPIYYISGLMIVFYPTSNTTLLPNNIVMSGAQITGNVIPTSGTIYLSTIALSLASTIPAMSITNSVALLDVGLISGGCYPSTTAQKYFQITDAINTTYYNANPLNQDRLILQNTTSPYIVCQPNNVDNNIPSTTIYGDLINNRNIQATMINASVGINTVALNVNNITQWSDKRIKKDIELADTKEEFNKVLKMKVRNYNHINEARKHHKKNILGFVAQELHEIDEDLVNTDGHQVIPNIMKDVKIRLIGQGSSKIFLGNIGTIEDINPDEIYEFNLIDPKTDEYVNTFECKVKPINNEEFVIFYRGELDLKTVIDGSLKLLMVGLYVDDFNTINYMRFNAYLVSCVQELHKRINVLEGKNENEAPHESTTETRTAVRSRRVKKPLIV